MELLLLTNEQRKHLESQVLNMQRHNIWTALKLSSERRDETWPYGCLCSDCQPAQGD